MKIKKGQIVAITTGEYSDYCLRDHMRALRDFDTDAEKARFLAQSPESYFGWGAVDAFLAWCVREGLAAPMENDEVVEFWVGS